MASYITPSEEEKARKTKAARKEQSKDFVLKKNEVGTDKDTTGISYGGISGAMAADPGSIDPNARIKTISGIGGKDIYKNTNVDESKYGKAIYSDTLTGAGASGFDKDIAKYGIGATGLDEEGNSTGTYTPFSSPVQSPEMQQKAGGIEMAGVNPVGAGSPYGKNQYGNVGQGTNGITVVGDGGSMSSGSAWWNKPRGERGGRSGEAQRIMDRMPYGTSGDRAKRRSMLEQARTIMGMGINENRTQTAAQRLAFEKQYGADKLAQEYGQSGIENQIAQQQLGISGINASAAMINAMKPGKPSSPYVSIPGEPTYNEQGIETGISEPSVLNQETGIYSSGVAPQQTIAGSTNPAISAETDEKAKAIQAKYQASNKTESDTKEANAAMAALMSGGKAI